MQQCGYFHWPCNLLLSVDVFRRVPTDTPPVVIPRFQLHVGFIPGCKTAASDVRLAVFSSRWLNWKINFKKKKRNLFHLGWRQQKTLKKWSAHFWHGGDGKSIFLVERYVVCLFIRWEVEMFQLRGGRKKKRKNKGGRSLTLLAFCKEMLQFFFWSSQEIQVSHCKTE